MDLILGSSVDRTTDFSFQASSSPFSPLAFALEPVMNQIKGKVNLYTPNFVIALTQDLFQVGVSIQSPVVTQPPFQLGSANDINNVQEGHSGNRRLGACLSTALWRVVIQRLQRHQMCH